MNTVAGWRTTTASSASISSSNGGKPSRSGRPAGRVGQKCQSGCSWSSSQRSFRGIERLEERDRVRDMDRDRHAELARGRPQRVEPRVVDRDEPSARVPRPQAEQLPDLEPARAGGDPVTQARGLGLAERRIVRPAVVVEARRTPPRGPAARPASARARRRRPSPQPPSRSTIALDARRVQHRARARAAVRAAPVAAERRRRGGCGRRSTGNRGSGTLGRRARGAPGRAGSRSSASRSPTRLSP